MIEILCYLLGLYALVLIIRVVLSWFPINPNGMGATVAGFIYLMTDPVLVPLRRVMPALRIGSVGLDLAPMALFFLITLTRSLIC
ncbi:MAG TPA: YggT family protein [Acidimicrobiales bacterium]|jgi:YggT family protein|nr:YggT family protein [Acidimicrobiales bacterium]